MTNVSQDKLSCERLAAVERVRDGWIRRLIDLSRRNNLLYYRELKTGTLDFSESHAKALTALLTGETVRLTRLLPQAEETGGVRRIQEIRRRALINLEEKGLETLFLALGMATWKADSGRPPAAAVLLVPIGVERGGIKLQRQGGVQVNPVLLHVLETEFGCRVTPDQLLGETSLEEIPNLITVYTQLSQAAVEVPGFEVKSCAVLSNFSFQKMVMVRDLRERLTEMASHRMIAAIAGDVKARESIRQHRRDLEPQTLDNIPPEQEFFVFDADSTQLRVIHAVLAAQNGVIQGPPGTGKSQTIANLIVALAAAGMRVLFVAEKRAALEVVMRRVEQKGLGHLLLDLHTTDFSRAQVLRQLAESLRLVRNAASVDSADVHHRFVDRRVRLNHHVQRLHQRQLPSGKSVYDIQGELLQFSPAEQLTLRFRGQDLDQLTAQKTNRVEKLLIEASGRELSPLFIGNHPSPWMGTQLTSGKAAQKAFDLAQQILQEHLPTLQAGLFSLIKVTQFNLPTTLDEVREILNLLQAVEKTFNLYSEEIFEQDLKELIKALSPVRIGLMAEGWAWFTDSNFRKALHTLEKLRQFKYAAHEQLLAEVTQVSQQLDDWQLRSQYASIPSLVPSYEEVYRDFQAFKHDLEEMEWILGENDLSQLTFSNLENLFKSLVADADTPLRVARLHQIEVEIEQCGAKAILTELRRLKSHPTLWSKQFRYAWLASCLDQLKTKDAALTVFDRETHEQLIDEFRQLDCERLRLAAKRVCRTHAERTIKVMNAHPEQEALVRREAEKKARHLPLRKLLAQAPDVVTTLRPCWMASPLSVSQLLDADRRYFDVVIFDEASQILPEDAVPALLRAKRVVVAGDKHQLPPTTFFVAGQEEKEEDVSSAEGFESLLDLMSSFLEPWPLEWHYRSRCEQLIAFSNRHIYDNRLITFPSPGGCPSISHILVSGIPDKDEREVQRVVELVLQHAAARPDETLGVITMGIKHAQRIEAALDTALKARLNLSAFFDESRSEHFFVKNIERVQGDERDAIILSVGYGKNSSGQLSYRFGPLLSTGGERRLNVALTRARRRMTLVTSFDHHDLEFHRCQGRGVELLRLYIQYAASQDFTRLPSEVGTGKDQVSAEGSSAFEADVFEALSAEGIPLLPQWGVSRYRIDMVAQHPQQPGRFVLAIECDGASYASVPTARERDRLRQQQLESLNWRFYRIWSVDWFNRRESEIERAVEAYKAAVAYANQADAQEIKPAEETLAASAELRDVPLNSRQLRPNVPQRSQIGEYTQAELITLIRWILSDGCLRTDDEILQEMVSELGFKKKGSRIERTVRSAIEQVRKT